MSRSQGPGAGGGAFRNTSLNVWLPPAAKTPVLTGTVLSFFSPQQLV